MGNKKYEQYEATKYIIVKPQFANFDKIIDLVKVKIVEKEMESIDSPFTYILNKNAQEHFKRRHEKSKTYYKKIRSIEYF